MLDLHTKEFGYTEISPPLIVNDNTMFGTGQLPKFEKDQFELKLDEKTEKKFLIPQIKKIQKKNIYIRGPHSADSMLNNINLKKFNCFIFCYHDQALVVYKYISKNRGINFTGGLSILRTSPDHGTAYNLVGSKNAENKSLYNCFNFLNKSNVNT